MIPFWNSTITLYKKTTAQDGVVNWKRSVHSHCFWQRKAIRDRTDGAEFKNTGVVCRIPAPYPDVQIGDIIVQGSIRDTVDEYVTGQRSADLLVKYAGRCMLVSEVHNNPRGMAGVDHLYAGG